MSADKSKAERLAELLLDGKGGLLIRRIDAAAELRRLSASEKELLDAMRVAVVALAGAAVNRPEFFEPYKVVSDAITSTRRPAMADKHTAEVLADDAPIGDTDRAHAWVKSARDMLRRIPALEAANAAFATRQEWWNSKMVELEAERDQLHAEVMEQARLLGMSGERELSLRAEIDRLRKDADRLDWLADPANTIGNVQLPRECVEQNLQSLRDAIDAAQTLK